MTTRTGYNNIALEVYERNSTTRVVDAGRWLERAEGVSWDSFFPGGLFGAARASVPGDPSRSWLFKQGQRLVVRNGLAVCYEGQLVNPGYGDGGRELRAAGAWGQILGLRGLRKAWCDTRLTDDAWPVEALNAGNEKCTIDRTSRIRFTPKAVAWATNEYACVAYNAPTGQTVKRITFDYDFQEAGQAWAFYLYNVTGAAYELIVTANATTSADLTFATPSSRLLFQYVSAANQTPAADGTIYASISNLKVYTETGSITSTEIAKDWRAAISDLSSSEGQIASNTTTLEPWVTGSNVDYETAADNLARLAALGDASINAWSAYCLESEAAPAPDGKPILCFQQQPALTDYDYTVRLDDATLGAVQLAKQEVENWIVVRYTDALGRVQWRTPDDDANLKDATSIATFGQREKVLNAVFNSLTAATYYGRRYLAEHKDERFYVAGDVPVVGYLAGKSGQPVPASLVRAGKRLRVENFLSDEIGTSGAGLTFLITRTQYDDPAETVRIACGVPDHLDVLLARWQFRGWA